MITSLIHTVLASIDINTNKSPFWKCVYAYMAFTNNDNTRPATWVFVVVSLDVIHMGRIKYFHTKESR